MKLLGRWTVPILILVLALGTASCSPAEPRLESQVTSTLTPVPVRLSQENAVFSNVTATIAQPGQIRVESTIRPSSTPTIPGILTSPLQSEITATAMPTPAPTAGPSLVPTPPITLTNPPTDPAAQVVALINQERTSRGLTALVSDPRLTTAAQSHSQDMATAGFFDHIGSDGSTPGDRITRTAYPWTFFAENLACRYSTAEEVVQGWLESPGHRANMLAPPAAHIGVGVVYDPQAECEFYWTSLFVAGG